MSFTGADFTIVIGQTNTVVALATTTSENGLSATVPTATTASTTSSGIITTLAIPTGTVISGPSTWDGKLTLPTPTTTFTLTASSGNTAAAALAIEVGAGDIPLTLDQAVKLTFAGQAGKLIGWSQAGTFHQITTACDSTTTPTLVAGADCHVDVGSDLIVWTKHFSTFIAFTETAIPPVSISGGNGSPFLVSRAGSGGFSSVTPSPAPVVAFPFVALIPTLTPIQLSINTRPTAKTRTTAGNIKSTDKKVATKVGEPTTAPRVASASSSFTTGLPLQAAVVQAIQNKGSTVHIKQPGLIQRLFN